MEDLHSESVKTSG